MYIEGDYVSLSLDWDMFENKAFGRAEDTVTVTMQLRNCKTDLIRQKDFKQLAGTKLYVSTKPVKNWTIFTDELPPKNTKILMKDLFDNIHVGVFANGNSILSSTGELLRTQVFYWKSIY